jgi:flagellar basal body-associated protein FliL
MANLTYGRVNRITANGTAVLLTGLLIAIAVGVAACRRSTSDGDGKDSANATDKQPLHLEPFIVNLADTDDSRFLRVGIDLDLERPPASKDVAASAARIRDCILTVLSSWHSDSLLATDGKQKLKDELRHALQDRVPELGVREVYFTEFLVQR